MDRLLTRRAMTILDLLEDTWESLAPRLLPRVRAAAEDHASGAVRDALDRIEDLSGYGGFTAFDPDDVEEMLAELRPILDPFLAEFSPAIEARLA